MKIFVVSLLSGYIGVEFNVLFCGDWVFYFVELYLEDSFVMGCCCCLWIGRRKCVGFGVCWCCYVMENVFMMMLYCFM